MEGYYAYVHSGAGSFFEDATLQSPNMTRTGAGCIVSFYYHMYIASGSSWTGTLYLKLNYKGSTSNLFEVSSNQGNKWKKAEVGLGRLDKGKLICAWSCIYWALWCEEFQQACCQF